jgi:hypothetical protein
MRLCCQSVTLAAEEDRVAKSQILVDGRESSGLISAMGTWLFLTVHSGKILGE